VFLLCHSLWGIVCRLMRKNEQFNRDIRSFISFSAFLISVTECVYCFKLY
jgi:hypothetical protein